MTSSMSDGTFSLRPLLKRQDYEYLSLRARNSQVAEFVSLDGHPSSEAKGYYLETLQSDKLLLMLFHRLDDPRIVYAFKPAGKDWRFVLGRIYPQDFDFDDLQDLFIELKGGQKGRANMKAEPEGVAASAEVGEVKVSVGATATPAGVEAQAEVGAAEDSTPQKCGE